MHYWEQPDIIDRFLSEHLEYSDIIMITKQNSHQAKYNNKKAIRRDAKKVYRKSRLRKKVTVNVKSI